MSEKKKRERSGMPEMSWKVKVPQSFLFLSTQQPQRFHSQEQFEFILINE